MLFLMRVAGRGSVPERSGSTPNVVKPFGRVPDVWIMPPPFARFAVTAKKPAIVDVQVRVVVVADAGTAKLPLATVLKACSMG